MLNFFRIFSNPVQLVLMCVPACDAAVAHPSRQASIETRGECGDSESSHAGAAKRAMHSRILIREFTSDHGKPKRSARPISQSNHVTRIEWFRPRYHGKSAIGFRFITSSTDEEGLCSWGESSSKRRPDRAESH